jgi:hypothetical protein
MSYLMKLPGNETLSPDDRENYAPGAFAVMGPDEFEDFLRELGRDESTRSENDNTHADAA